MGQRAALRDRQQGDKRRGDGEHDPAPGPAVAVAGELGVGRLVGIDEHRHPLAAAQEGQVGTATTVPLSLRPRLCTMAEWASEAWLSIPSASSAIATQVKKRQVAAMVRGLKR